MLAPLGTATTHMSLKQGYRLPKNKLVRLLLGLSPRTHLTPVHFDRLEWLRSDDRAQHLAMGLVLKITPPRYTLYM